MSGRRQPKYRYDEVKQIFEEKGCQFLSTEYKTTNDQLDYVCNCGTVDKITVRTFLEGIRCKNCKYKALVARRKLPRQEEVSYEEVKKYFSNQGCQLLSTEYKCRVQKLDYICSCGNIGCTRFANFEKGNRCKECIRKIFFDSARKAGRSMEYIESEFKIRKYQLLSTEYRHNKKLDYICHCGNIDSILFDKLLKNQKCKLCSGKGRASEESR